MLGYHVGIETFCWTLNAAVLRSQSAGWQGRSKKRIMPASYLRCPSISSASSTTEVVHAIPVGLAQFRQEWPNFFIVLYPPWIGMCNTEFT